MTTRLVKKQPVDTGISGWRAIAKRPFAPQQLERDINADWLVIGAGFAGLSAAQRLIELQPRANVVVVDATEVAEGPAGRNTGYMIDVPHNVSTGGYASDNVEETQREIMFSRHAISFAKRVACEYEISKQAFDPSGKINAAATARGEKLNEGFSQSLAYAGESFEKLDTSTMREITGCDYYCSGIYTPGAVMIQPAEYIYGFSAGLRSKNVSLYENTPVVELSREASTWKAKTPKGSISAEKVILAVNGHVQSFGFYKRKLMHVFTYASMTEGFVGTKGRDCWAITPADPMGATVRQFLDNGKTRIVVRNGFTYNPDLETTVKTIEKMKMAHRESFERRFPHYASVPFEYSWGGRLCLSWNHSPAFGELDNNLYSACCENGLGTVKSTLAGKMAVELATGVSSEMLEDYLKYPAPNTLPPEPFASLGIRSVIRYQEMRAGREC